MVRACIPVVSNGILAANLREYADLLEQQGADGFRVAANRRGADVVERLDRPVAELAAAGRWVVRGREPECEAAAPPDPRPRFPAPANLEQ